MAQFHPDIHWLTEYSAASLPVSQALCVAAHLEFCSQCHDEVEQLNSLGSALLCNAQTNSQESKNDISTTDRLAKNDNSQYQINSADTELSNTLIDNVLGMLHKFPAEKKIEIERSIDNLNQEPKLPLCMQKLMPDGINHLNWKKLTASLSLCRLATGDKRREVALHRISPGGGVANHDHRGREITVVLHGSFSDQLGHYLPGDFLIKDVGDEHKPVASEHTECICLAVLDAPVKFTGLFTQLINPFLKIYPNRI